MPHNRPPPALSFPRPHIAMQKPELRASFVHGQYCPWTARALKVHERAERSGGLTVVPMELHGSFD